MTIRVSDGWQIYISSQVTLSNRPALIQTLPWAHASLEYMSACISADLTRQPWTQDTTHLTNRGLALQIQIEAEIKSERADRNTGIWVWLVDQPESSEELTVITETKMWSATEQSSAWWARKWMKRQRIRMRGWTDRRHIKPPYLPVPECRFILNAVSTAGPSWKDRQTWVRRQCQTVGRER